jgi:hypothetical protein
MKNLDPDPNSSAGFESGFTEYESESLLTFQLFVMDSDGSGPRIKLISRVVDKMFSLVDHRVV